MKCLVVNADDFGYDPAINAAVEQAHEHGILTSASLMIQAAHADEAIRIARRNPDLGVGLHLCLNAADVPASNRLPPLPAGPISLWRGLALDLGRLYQRLTDQIRNQILCFQDTGLKLTHLDTHMHMHIHPVVFELVLESALAYKVPAVRLPSEPLWPSLRAQRGRKLVRLARWAVFSACRPRNRRVLRGVPVAEVARTVGLLNPGHVTESFLCRYLPMLPDGVTEIFCHPAGYRSPFLSSRQGGYDHEGELAALCSPSVRRVLDDQGIQLAHFGSVPCQ